MHTNQRLAATVISAVALAAPAAAFTSSASAMPAPPSGPGTGSSDVQASPAPPPEIVKSGVGTVTVLLLAGGGLTAGLAGGLGGPRLRRRYAAA